MRGRKPVPTAVKKRRGTFRPDRAAPDEAAAPMGPDVTGTIPPPPPWLRGVSARAMWRRKSRQLWFAGLLPRVSEEVLARYCKHFDLFLTAERKVQELGQVVTAATGNLVVNPWLSVMNRHSEMMARIEVEFGMTPSSKVRVPGGAAPTPPTGGKGPAPADPKSRLPDEGDFLRYLEGN